MKISSKITSILLIAALAAGSSVFAASAIDEENSIESNSNNKVVAYAESVEVSVDASPEIMVEEVATNPVATGTVQISRNKLTLGVGEGFKLSATVKNTNDPSQALSWSSSNKAVLTVTGNGNIKAVKEGTAVVTVKLKNGSSASCTVTVKKAPTSISLNKKSITLGVGEVFDLNSSLPSGCGAYSIKYYSNNSSVAPVKAAGGLVTAKRAGTAVITAKTYNGKTAKCTVKVSNASYTQDDLYCLAAVIWQEAGASYCSDRLQLLVANVVMNHVESPYFPNTIRGVITRKGAYGRMYWDGVSIPKANDPITKAAIDRCYANAKKILEGYRILPSSVIYQAGFVQGSGVYTYEEGMYFCYK